MKPLFQKISILGLGLLGGSIALEIKKRRLADTVLGYNRSAKSRRIALNRKACDQAFADPIKAVADADLVILATPVRNIPTLAKKIAPHLKRGALVTDVGSTKEVLIREVAKALPKNVFFIGGHPIAGTEKTGMESAELGLFQDHWWVLVPGRRGSASNEGVKKLYRLVKALGAKPVTMSPRDHDQILGAISHLPHLLAYSLMHTVTNFQKGRALKFAGRSFRDVTRIAASSPTMWTDICLDNRRALLDWLKKYEKILKSLKKDLASGKGQRLQHFFERAAQARRNI